MKKVLIDFLEYWRDKEEVIGIVLCGSYSINMENTKSDIDIRIILDNNIEFSFKGLEERQGYSFSYVARTKAVIKNKFNSDFFSNSKIEARSFYLGRILYDKIGDVKELKEISKYYFEQPFIKKNDIESMKSMMYSLHSRFSYLKSINVNSPFFLYNYIHFMRLALIYYSKTLNLEMVIDTKLERLLTDEEYVKKNNFSLFPDKEFIELWIRNLSKERIEINSLKEIYEYLKLKIFNIDSKKHSFYWK